MRAPFRIALIAGALMLLAFAAETLQGQQPAGATSLAPRATPFSVDLGLFYQNLDNGYSDWRGTDLRVSYTGHRASPFAGVSTQQRDDGSQTSYGLGSYLTINRYLYSIVGFSVATGGTAVFYPRLRWDASLMADSRVVPGLVIGAGYTHISFGGPSTGSIATIGPIYYHGPLILTGAVHLNHDGTGGANTASSEIGGQYGGEGRYWLGASLSGGREAYEILSPTPLEANFTNIGGALFYQRWLTRTTALTARAEYQHKLRAYRRRGLSLSYHVAF